MLNDHNIGKILGSMIYVQWSK